MLDDAGSVGGEQPGHRVLIHDCEVCGAPAAFGINVNLRRALETGDVKHAGKWFCFEHWKERRDAGISQ